MGVIIAVLRPPIAPSMRRTRTLSCQIREPWGITTMLPGLKFPVESIFMPREIMANLPRE